MTLRSEQRDTEADNMIVEAAAVIQARADEVLEFLNNGDITMDEAIAEYNEDPGMTTMPEGYMISDKSTTLMRTFVEGGMALDNIGDISGLVATDYGYHIIEYSSDLESSTIDIELVRDALYDDLLVSLAEEQWDNLVISWVEEYDITYYYENLIENNEE